MHIQLRPRNATTPGYTLIELIMVMVMLAGLVVAASVFIVTPFRVSQDIDRRTELVDLAQLTLSRITREIRRALPNSVRIDGSGRVVEFLYTRSGGRYRRQPDGGGGGQVLDVNANAGTFDVLGTLPNRSEMITGGAGDCATSLADCVAVYNTGAGSTDAFGLLNVATLTAHTATSLSYASANPAGFPTHSPSQRFFVIEGPVTYRCTLGGPGAGALRRHVNYGLFAVQPTDLATLGAGSLLADHIDACSFTYQSGAGSRHGLLTVNLTLRDGDESVSLLQQVHVVNVP